MHIRELASDDCSVFDYLYGDAPLNPASNHKLLTTAAALDLLGPEFRFETRALRAGDALYVIGEGDPTLDALALRAMATEIAAATDLGSAAPAGGRRPRVLAADAGAGLQRRGRGCVVPGAERGR